MTVGGDDRGVATVWAAGAIMVLASVALFGLYLGEAVLARHHAESAADLAALAAVARALLDEPSACAQARRVTDRMHVQLLSCHQHNQDVLVHVSAPLPAHLPLPGSATAQARAGPATPH